MGDDKGGVIATTPGVLIDACVQRTGLERLDVLIEYFKNMESNSLGHRKVYASLLRSRCTITEEFAHELEDEVISCINVKLPDDFVCTVGEFQPGDVIVREIGADEIDDDPTSWFGAGRMV